MPDVNTRPKDILPKKESKLSSKATPAITAGAALVETTVGQTNTVFEAIQNTGPKMGLDQNTITQISDWTNGLNITNMALRGIFYLVKMLSFGMAENKTLMESGGFILDTAKIIVYFTLAAAVIAAAPFAGVVMAAVMTITTSLDLLWNIGSLVKNAVQYSIATGSTGSKDRTVYKERKLHMDNMKTASKAIGKSVIALGLSLTAMLVPAIAPWIGWAGAAIGGIFMAVGVYKIGQQLKAKYAPAKDKSAVKVALKKEKIDFKNTTNFKVNDLTFQSTTVLDNLTKHVKSVRILQQSDGIKFDTTTKKFTISSPLDAKKLQKLKPNALKKLKEHEKFILTKEMDAVNLQNEIAEVTKRITRELIVSNQLKHHSQAEKRKQKILALEDLQFILLQLIDIHKITDPKQKQILFLNYRSAKNLSESADGKPVVLTIENFHANKDKILKEIDSYFKKNYPQYQNSDFKHAKELGAGSGEVKSLFDSVEAWMKQKTVKELTDEIDKNMEKYAKVDKSGKSIGKPSKEDLDKENALLHLKKLLPKLEILTNRKEYEQLSNTNSNQFVIYENATDPKIYYDKNQKKLICEYKNTSPSGVVDRGEKSFDLSNLEQKEAFMRYILDDAKKKFPALADSDRALGKVAKMYDEVFTWVKMQDCSHLAPLNGSKQVPVTPPTAVLPSATPTPAVSAATLPAASPPVAPAAVVAPPAVTTAAAPTSLPMQVQPGPKPVLTDNALSGSTIDNKKGKKPETEERVIKRRRNY